MQLQHPLIRKLGSFLETPKNESPHCFTIWKLFNSTLKTKRECHPLCKNGIPFSSYHLFYWLPRHVKLSLKSGRFSGLRIDLLTLLP